MGLDKLPADLPVPDIVAVQELGIAVVREPEVVPGPEVEPGLVVVPELAVEQVPAAEPVLAVKQVALRRRLHHHPILPLQHS